MLLLLGRKCTNKKPRRTKLSCSWGSMYEVLAMLELAAVKVYGEFVVVLDNEWTHGDTVTKLQSLFEHEFCFCKLCLRKVRVLEADNPRMNVNFKHPVSRSTILKQCFQQNFLGLDESRQGSLHIPAHVGDATGD